MNRGSYSSLTFKKRIGMAEHLDKEVEELLEPKVNLKNGEKKHVVTVDGVSGQYRCNVCNCFIGKSKESMLEHVKGKKHIKNCAKDASLTNISTDHPEKEAKLRHNSNEALKEPTAEKHVETKKNFEKELNALSELAVGLDNGKKGYVFSANKNCSNLQKYFCHVCKTFLSTHQSIIHHAKSKYHLKKSSANVFSSEDFPHVEQKEDTEVLHAPDATADCVLPAGNLEVKVLNKETTSVVIDRKLMPTEDNSKVTEPEDTSAGRTTEEVAEMEWQMKILLGLVVKLNDGKEGYVFTLEDPEKPFGLFNCHVCQKFKMPDAVAHAKNRLHLNKLAAPVFPSPNFTKLKNKETPGVLSKVVDGRPDISKLRKCIPSFNLLEKIKHLTEITVQLDNGEEGYVFTYDAKNHVEGKYFCHMCGAFIDPYNIVGHAEGKRHFETCKKVKFPHQNFTKRKEKSKNDDLASKFTASGLSHLKQQTIKLLEQTVKLDNGEVGYVFTVHKFSFWQWEFTCHTCQLIFLVEHNLLAHSTSKRHNMKLSSDTFPRENFIKLKDKDLNYGVNATDPIGDSMGTGESTATSENISGEQIRELLSELIDKLEKDVENSMVFEREKMKEMQDSCDEEGKLENKQSMTPSEILEQQISELSELVTRLEENEDPLERPGEDDKEGMIKDEIIETEQDQVNELMKAVVKLNNSVEAPAFTFASGQYTCHICYAFFDDKKKLLDHTKKKRHLLKFNVLKVAEDVEEKVKNLMKQVIKLDNGEKGYVFTSYNEPRLIGMCYCFVCNFAIGSMVDIVTHSNTDGHIQNCCEPILLPRENFTRIKSIENKVEIDSKTGTESSAITPVVPVLLLEKEIKDILELVVKVDSGDEGYVFTLNCYQNTINGYNCHVCKYSSLYFSLQRVMEHIESEIHQKNIAAGVFPSFNFSQFKNKIVADGEMSLVAPESEQCLTPAAPVNEKDTKYTTIYEMIKEVLELVVELDNGDEGFVFTSTTYSINSQTRYNCHVCKIFLRPCDLLSHAKSRRHNENIESAVFSRANFTMTRKKKIKVMDLCTENSVVAIEGVTVEIPESWSKTEKKLIKELFDIVVRLDNGGEGYVFTVSSPLRVNCHVCGGGTSMRLLELFQHAFGKRHSMNASNHIYPSQNFTKFKTKEIKDVADSKPAVQEVTLRNTSNDLVIEAVPAPAESIEEQVHRLLGLVVKLDNGVEGYVFTLNKSCFPKIRINCHVCLHTTDDIVGHVKDKKHVSKSAAEIFSSQNFTKQKKSGEKIVIDPDAEKLIAALEGPKKQSEKIDAIPTQVSETQINPTNTNEQMDVDKLLAEHPDKFGQKLVNREKVPPQIIRDTSSTLASAAPSELVSYNNIDRPPTLKKALGEKNASKETKTSQNPEVKIGWNKKENEKISNQSTPARVIPCSRILPICRPAHTTVPLIPSAGSKTIESVASDDGGWNIREDAEKNNILTKNIVAVPNHAMPQKRKIPEQLSDIPVRLRDSNPSMENAREEENSTGINLSPDELEIIRNPRGKIPTNLLKNTARSCNPPIVNANEEDLRNPSRDELEIITNKRNEISVALLEATDHTDIVSVLLLLTELESLLGSLAPRIMRLFTQAVALEKLKKDEAMTLLDVEENVNLLNTVKVKLKGQLLAKIVERHMVPATEKAISTITALLEAREEKNKVPTMTSPVIFPGVGVVDKMAVARQIAAALIAQGKTDVSEEALEELINAVTRIAQQEKEAENLVSDRRKSKKEKKIESTTSNLQNLLSSVVETYSTMAPRQESSTLYSLRECGENSSSRKRKKNSGNDEDDDEVCFEDIVKAARRNVKAETKKKKLSEEPSAEQNEIATEVAASPIIATVAHVPMPQACIPTAWPHQSPYSYGETFSSVASSSTYASISAIAPDVQPPAPSVQITINNISSDVQIFSGTVASPFSHLPPALYPSAEPTLNYQHYNYSDTSSYSNYVDHLAAPYQNYPSHEWTAPPVQDHTHVPYQEDSYYLPDVSYPPPQPEPYYGEPQYHYGT